MEAKNKPQYRIIPQYVPEEYRSSDAPNAVPLYGYKYLHNTAAGEVIIGEYLFGSTMQAVQYIKDFDQKEVHSSSILQCIRGKLKRVQNWIFKRSRNSLDEDSKEFLVVIHSRPRVCPNRCGVKNEAKNFNSKDKISKLWCSILVRGNTTKCRGYEGVSICASWKNFDNFRDWYLRNYPEHLEQKGIELNLDKDLLSGERKIYSPETCIFLPANVNRFISNKQKKNLSGITGVHYLKHRDRWRADITDPRIQNNFGGLKTIGTFKTKEEAAEAYAKYRAEIAEYYKQYMRDLGYPEDIVEKIS